jgi:hypothetical protein
MMHASATAHLPDTGLRDRSVACRYRPMPSFGPSTRVGNAASAAGVVAIDSCRTLNAICPRRRPVEPSRARKATDTPTTRYLRTTRAAGKRRVLPWPARTKPAEAG